LKESSLAILAEAQNRLSQLIVGGELYFPPNRLQLRHPKAIFLGKASIEQQAIATLFDQVCTEHGYLHEVERLPVGINPRVSFEHYQKHVMAPLLFELLIWSAHRDYPDIAETLSIGAIQIDADWNLYAIPRVIEKAAS
jgi:hypothetical protein